MKRFLCIILTACIPFCLKAGDEKVAPDFETFFQVFNSDSLFHLEHTLYPVLYTYQTETKGPKYEGLKKNRPLYFSYQLDKVTTKIKNVVEGMIFFSVVIPDTDQGEILVFRLLNNDWFLTDILDESYYYD